MIDKEGLQKRSRKQQICDVITDNRMSPKGKVLTTVATLQQMFFLGTLKVSVSLEFSNPLLLLKKKTLIRRDFRGQHVCYQLLGQQYAILCSEFT